MSKRYEEKERIALIDKVLKLAETMSVNEACKSVGLSPSTLLSWVNVSADLVKNYARARSLYHDSLAQQILDLSNEEIPKYLERGEANAWVQRQRMRIDALKWTLSKVAPKKYGDRLTLAGDEQSPLVVAKITREVIDTKPEEISE